MTPEKRHLVHSLLDEERDIRREATLLAGKRILRRKRWRRAALRTFEYVILLGIASFSMQRLLAPKAPYLTAHPAPQAPIIHALTDDELLALFPDTPVGLATLEDGKKRLIFPRPGDEERYVSKAF